MQIATLTYQYNPKENVNGEGPAKLRQRRMLTTIANPKTKVKQRQSLQSKLSSYTNGSLPPITNKVQPRNSVGTKGSNLPSSKLGDISTHSFRHQSRSQSQLSNRSENNDTKSPSGSPKRVMRPSSKLIRVKFGYPVKVRSPDFYGPERNKVELRLRENSFVNDSIRAANQHTLVQPYEPLDDPHLRRFFQSPIVLDVVRKSISVEPNTDISTKLANISKRSKSNDLYDPRNNEYLRIVAKSSSGYAKLNGYDCIPSTSPARSKHHRSSINESSLSQSKTHDKHQASATPSSLKSYPTHSSNQNKKSLSKTNKRNQLKPLATSSPLRQSRRQSNEVTTSNNEALATTKMNDHVPEENNEFINASTESQD